MKRIIICFDGTWNRIDAEEPTNVLMLATGIAPLARDGVGQVIRVPNPSEDMPENTPE